MKQILKIIILLIGVTFDQPLLAQDNNTRIIQHIETLSSDEMKGRLVGSTGEKMAAEYLTAYFQSLNLNPLPNYDFVQPFTFNYAANPHNLNEVTDTLVGNNVVAFLDNGREHTFIIGAHFDHLGLNEYNLSKDPQGKGMIHNGADDNASGVSAVLELAHIYSTNQYIEPVNFIFACFSGEELGLMGSKALAEILEKEDLDVSFMGNFDMIGRMDSDNELNIGGVGTSTHLSAIIYDKKPTNFNLKIDSSGVGPSDHTSFYEKEIPVLFFFTGLHIDYHKPTDDAHKINYKKVDEIIDYAKSIIDTLSFKPDMVFTQTKYKSKKDRAPSNVSLGIFPDYKNYGDGMHILEVLEDRPAQKYGLQKGDIITQIGQIKVTEIYSYMEALSKLEKNKKYKLTYKRNNKMKSVKIQF